MEIRYKISINQFADFSIGTEAKKKRIIKQQKEPNKFLVSWYQLPKARIRKSLKDNCILEPILKGIEELEVKNPTSSKQAIDRIVSIEALRRYINIKLPDILKDVPYEIVKKVSTKSIQIEGVEIIISPDVIFKLKIKDKIYIGGVKIHISKNNVFDSKQSKFISSLVYKYLEENIATKDEIVLKELCLSIDVFGEKAIKVPKDITSIESDIRTICREIKLLWDVA